MNQSGWLQCVALAFLPEVPDSKPTEVPYKRTASVSMITRFCDVGHRPLLQEGSMYHNIGKDHGCPGLARGQLAHSNTCASVYSRRGIVSDPRRPPLSQAPSQPQEDDLGGMPDGATARRNRTWFGRPHRIVFALAAPRRLQPDLHAAAPVLG